MKEKIPFNDWSKERIKQKRKFCTSRHIKYTKDKRVHYITEKIDWYIIREFLWQTEGADSPEELQKVIESIYKRFVSDDEQFFVHFGDFSDEVKNTKK
jgi:hypothetical protein